jgi:hypothetical protein
VDGNALTRSRVRCTVARAAIEEEAVSEQGSGSKKLIGEWLIELVEDPELMKGFRADPDKALQDSGLSDDQQRVLRSGDQRAIREAVRGEYGRTEIMLFPMFFMAAGHSDDDGSEDSDDYGSEASKEAE